MENKDKQFEEYLSEFQPRKPRALPEEVVPGKVWPRRLAAAAAIAVALGVSLWPVRRNSVSQGQDNLTGRGLMGPERPKPRRALSTVVLTHIAVENPAGLDAALEEAGENQLPKFDRKNSTLRILARE